MWLSPRSCTCTPAEWVHDSNWRIPVSTRQSDRGDEYRNLLPGKKSGPEFSLFSLIPFCKSFRFFTFNHFSFQYFVSQFLISKQSSNRRVTSPSPKYNMHLPLSAFLLIPFNCLTNQRKMLPEPDTERCVMILINARDDTQGRLKAEHNYIPWLLRASGDLWLSLVGTGIAFGIFVVLPKCFWVRNFERKYSSFSFNAYYSQKVTFHHHHHHHHRHPPPPPHHHHHFKTCVY